MGSLCKSVRVQSIPVFIEIKKSLEETVTPVRCACTYRNNQRFQMAILESKAKIFLNLLYTHKHHLPSIEACYP